MRREFDRLGEGPFDLLVIGGGIYGAWVAYDAALRGLDVALVEREDWAAATSSGSSKLIHGGLRYLEQGRLRLVRRALDERRRLVRLGPHRVAPLRFVLPVYRGDRVGRLRLRAGLWLYDRLAGGDQPVASHDGLSRSSLVARFPFLRERDLLGGFGFGDGVTDDARFTLEIVSGALDAGAVAVNRAAARELLVGGERIAGALVEDRETGRTLEVRSRMTVLAAGAWVPEILARARVSAAGPVRRTKGVHLVLPPLGCDEAFLLPSDGERRVVFLIPWYGKTLLGTTDTDHDGTNDDVRVEPADVSYLLGQANRVLGGPGWTERDVVAGFAALRTLRGAAALAPSAVTREWCLEEPRAGLIASLGGKLTSARADAAEIVDLAIARLGQRARPSATATRPFPWTPAGPWEDWQRDRTLEARRLGLDEETARTAVRRFGTRFDRLLARVRSAPDLAARVVPDAPFCLAEIAHAAEDEMARTLEDVLRRRVPASLLSPLEPTSVERVARIVAEVNGWSVERRRAEVETFFEQARSAVG